MSPTRSLNTMHIDLVSTTFDRGAAIAEVLLYMR
jgi:hypothetical protein